MIRIRRQVSLGVLVLATGLFAIGAVDVQKMVAANLANFDDLDYNVFSNQKWTELHRSHAANIAVHWPDGHVTHGIEKHIEDLKAMFVYAPDTRIKQHPVKVGQGDWTAVIGVMEGPSPSRCRSATERPSLLRGSTTRSAWRPSGTGRTASWTRNTSSGTTRNS